MYSEKTENGHTSILQIKQDDKFFCRLLSKESSVSNNPSFRVTPVAVPFLWESHPGTPKHPFFSDISLPPPLTPPPSYFYNNNKKPTKKNVPRSNLFPFSFFKFSLKKTLLLTSSLSSSSSSSSSSDSSRTVGSNNGRRRRRFSSCDFSADLWGNSNCEQEDEDNGGVVVADSRRNPRSCFGFRRSSSFNGGFGGFYGRQG